MYKYIVVIFIALICYNYISSYIKTKSLNKTEGVIVREILNKQHGNSWYFEYKYKNNLDSVLDSTKTGSISPKLFEIGEKVEVLYDQNGSILNSFSELYFPNTFLFFVFISIHYLRKWILEGFNSNNDLVV